MKKFLKIFGYILLGIVVIIAAMLIYIKTALPNVGDPEEMNVELTPERIERGKYLANSVSACMDCHSTRDWSKYSGPLVEGTLGKGGERFGPEFGFPGTYYSKNITPFALERYTDGELFRVITTGVTKEGRAMFPVMPYPYYGKMDPEDIKSIIAYLRTLPKIESSVPESESNFPMNFIINMIPQKANPQKLPPKTDKIAYGGYLSNAAGCIECHTKAEKGRIIPELQYSGGREFKMPDGSVLRSSNITPDKATGIGLWSEDLFVSRFKAYGDSSYVSPSVKPGEFNTIMPWTMYAKMTEEDLRAIYTYLQSVPQIRNIFAKYTKK